MKFSVTAPSAINQPVDNPQYELVTKSVLFPQSVNKQGLNFKCKGSNSFKRKVNGVSRLDWFLCFVIMQSGPNLLIAALKCQYIF